MRKAICLLLLFLIGSGLILAAGCAREPVLDLSGYSEGEKQGDNSDSDALNEEEIVAPVYPNAEPDERTTRSMEKVKEKDKVDIAMAAYWTGDSVADVITWYKKELLGKKDLNNMSSTVDGSEVGMFSFKSGDRTISITIDKDKVDSEKTVIRIIISTAEPGTDTE